MSATSKMPMQSPQDLFVHELSDMYSAEQIIVQMLDQAKNLVQDQQLKDALQMHEEQSRQHAQRVQQAIQQTGEQRHPVQCHAMQGMQEEVKEVQQSQPSAEVMQGAITGGACKTEHYEIAAYSGLIEKAKAMGQTDIANLLQQNLDDEQQMLKKVEQISHKLTQQIASMPGMQSSQHQSMPAG